MQVLLVAAKCKMNANNCTDHKSVYRFYKFSIDIDYAEIVNAHDGQDFVNHDSYYLENWVKHGQVNERQTFDQEFESQK